MSTSPEPVVKHYRGMPVLREIRDVATHEPRMAYFQKVGWTKETPGYYKLNVTEQHIDLSGGVTADFSFTREWVPAVAEGQWWWEECNRDSPWDAAWI